MGKLFSKTEKKRPRVQSVADNSEEDIAEYVEDKYDQEAIRKLKKEFNNNMDLFLMNQILMSVMFFQNYDTEIAQLSNKKGYKDLNPKLLKEFQKSCIKPDVMAKLVNQYIKFGTDEDLQNDNCVPLLHRRMLIIHDNIEIISKEEDGHYSGIDKPTFKAFVVDSEKTGYVKLKHLVEDQHCKSTSISSNSTSDSDPNFPIEKKSSNDEESVYCRINDARTPKPLTSSSAPAGRLPDKFIKTFKVKNLENDVNTDELYRIEHYLDSKELMTHFRKRSFQIALGKALGFNLKDVEEAMYTNVSIFCKNYVKQNLVHWEIIPAVTIPWPESRTMHWWHSIRTDRNRIVDKNNKSYKWPSNRMLEEIRGMTCIVIPRGFMPKRGVHENSNLEWEIGFPKAERYLETHMSHAHMRAFLILTTLFKTFIEPITDKKGILVEHIRNHLFLEIEKNPIDWPENRLGTKLKKVMKRLIASMGGPSMPDYFMRDKNLFENIPGPYLREAQKQLHDVEQAPVMPFILALRNLQYIHEDFYPQLEFKKLHHILITSGLKNTNPVLYDSVQTIGIPTTARERSEWDKARRSSKQEREFRLRKQEYEWRMKKQELERKKKLERKRVEEDEKKRANLNKPPTDSINLRWTSGNYEDDPYKGRLILIFFLDHFIDIVKASIKYGATMQGLLYLKQCTYLTALLDEQPSSTEDAVGFRSEIMRLELELLEKTTNPPQTPARNSFYVPKNIAIDNIYTVDTTMKKKPKSIKIIETSGTTDVLVTPSPKTVAFDEVVEISEI